MSYTALYRKFRPVTFDEVKGQDPIVRTLQNQIRNKRVGHAYLLCGTRGTGKTTIAKLLAKAVNCQNPVDGNPCLQCESCQRIAAGNSMNVIEMDAASNNGVDTIREIVDEVSYSPAEGKYRVYIIDEVHMLSTGAFNALLKTLEEPPSYVIFILATTEVHKIPVTILSRCQRYDFRRITTHDIADKMKELLEKEAIVVDERALLYIAKAADGSLRDGLSLLDQCLAFHYGDVLTYDKVLDVLGAVDTEVFERLYVHIYGQDALAAMMVLDEVVLQGRDLGQFVTDFLWFMRNLLFLCSAEGARQLVDVSDEAYESMSLLAKAAQRPILERYLQGLSELAGQMRYASNKRIILETAIIRLCRPQMQKDDQALLDRIRRLETLIEEGVPLQRPSGSQVERSSEAGAPVIPKMVYPKSIPEDITKVIKAWNRILADVPPPLGICLKGSVPGMSPQGELVIQVKDPGKSVLLLNEWKTEEIQKIFSDYLQKEITVKVLCGEEVSAKEMFPDLRKVLDVDVLIEEE